MTLQQVTFILNSNISQLCGFILPPTKIPPEGGCSEQSRHKAQQCLSGKESSYMLYSIIKGNVIFCFFNLTVPKFLWMSELPVHGVPVPCSTVILSWFWVWKSEFIQWKLVNCLSNKRKAPSMDTTPDLFEPMNKDVGGYSEVWHQDNGQFGMWDYTEVALKTIHAFISSHLHYCKALYSGSHQKSICCLQLAQNAV